MGRNSVIAFIAIALSVVTFSGRSPALDTDAHHVMLTPGEIKWGPATALGPGIQIAVLSGDPFKAGAPFVFRLELADGTKVAPHWHPVDENVTVMSGTFLLGAGEKFDPNAMRELLAGSYAFMPKRARHFALARGDTIVQLNGTGPFKIIYVNPADDPSRKTNSQGK